MLGCSNISEVAANCIKHSKYIEAIERGNDGSILVIRQKRANKRCIGLVMSTITL